MLEHIFIKDGKSRTYDHMTNLREGVAHHISANVVRMQEAGMKVTVCCADIIDDGSFAKQIAHTRENDLYNRLVIEYNAAHPETIMYYWTRD